MSKTRKNKRTEKEKQLLSDIGGKYDGNYYR